MKEGFTLKTTFDEAGMDSLDRIAFLTSVEAEFKCLFEDNNFDNFRCFDDVVNYLSQTFDAM